MVPHRWHQWDEWCPSVGVGGTNGAPLSAEGMAPPSLVSAGGMAIPIAGVGGWNGAPPIAGVGWNGAPPSLVSAGGIEWQELWLLTVGGILYQGPDKASIGPHPVCRPQYGDH